METYEIIKNIRLDNGLTQSAFGRILNCDRYRIADIERGKSSPTIEDIRIISKEFNVSSDYLLGISNVKSVDTDVKAICEYTGLDEEAIIALHEYKGFSPTDKLISNMILDGRVDDIACLAEELKKYCDKLIKVHEQVEMALETSDFSEIHIMHEKNEKDEETIRMLGSDSRYAVITDEYYADFLVFRLKKIFIDMIEEIANYSYLRKIKEL